MIKIGNMVMENIEIKTTDFEIPAEVLDQIQQNIQDIIRNFDIPDANKDDVLKKINFMYSQTRQMTVTDALTKLYNRRHFESNFEREYMRAKRYNSNLSLAIVDIDFFKNFNDTYGHSCGDYVLKELAYLLLNSFRQTDMVFRYGGEEFAVILTETPKQTAFVPLERFRKFIENYNFKFRDKELKVTVSIGVSSNTSFETPWEMFDDADKALYEAKNNGRNRVSSAE